MREYLTIGASVITESSIKKSRFIAALYPTETEANLELHLLAARERWPRASHYCYAALWQNPVPTERFSDDGEPSGTAGRPMLTVLHGSGLTNIVGIVTRYFGGTLLGTGGLVRAYSETLQDALKNAEIVCMTPALRLHIKLPYSHYDVFLSKMEQNLIGEKESCFSEQVDLYVWIPWREASNFYQRLADLGPIAHEELEQGYIPVPMQT